MGGWLGAGWLVGFNFCQVRAADCRRYHRPAAVTSGGVSPHGTLLVCVGTGCSLIKNHLSIRNGWKRRREGRVSGVVSYLFKSAFDWYLATC